MWFSKTIEEVLDEFKVNPLVGLNENEAAASLEKFGPNKLPAKKKRSIFRLFVGQLQQWLIYILIVAVIITIFMGEYIDATIIIIVILTNAVLGVIQEVKAGKAIDALQKMSFPKALVLRNGHVNEVNSNLIVPGDILILDSGRFIAADIRLIESANLQIDESTLTGESVASDKDAFLLHEDTKTPLADQSNMAFMATLIIRGRGAGVVVETGINTELGKIANLIISEKKSKTPLEVRLDKLGKTLGIFAIGICTIIFIISLFQGRDLAEMFILSVSLAVAAIPEGLAAIVAVVLSVGVTSMSKKKVVIRKLPAVETLGSVNIICSDKTGTLTQNKMTVTRYFNLDGEKLVKHKKNNNSTQDVKLLVKAMILSSDATFDNGIGTGDPTEIALLQFGDDIGIDRKKMNSGNKRVGEFTFDSDRKLMSTLNEESGKYNVYTKGAIGNLIQISTHVLKNGQVVPITDKHKRMYESATKIMSDNALRTLGVAYKQVSDIIDSSEMEQDLIFAGLVGMMDPPRSGVKSSVQLAKNAGITTVMITGDHKNTAFAIANELGMAETIEQAITGKELDDFSEKEFTEKLINYRVFARVSPEHKVKIIRALKSYGNTVSMTGDGVNDAPSLHAADIGIAMGISGTDAAKGASDMILMDDNFSTIVSAIEQGRNIYNNIKKSVIFLLTCNLGEVITMVVSLLIGLEAPLIATQLLWINLITDSFPAIALGMDPGNPEVMNEKPRNSKESFFAGGTGIHVILGGVLIGGLTMAAFWYGYYHRGYSPYDNSAPSKTTEYARTMAFMVLVMCQLFYSLALRNRSKSIFQIGIFSNKYLIGAIFLGIVLQLIVIMIPAFKTAFHLQMLDMDGWIVALLLGLIPLFFNEIFKIFLRVNVK